MANLWNPYVCVKILSHNIHWYQQFSLKKLSWICSYDHMTFPSNYIHNGKITGDATGSIEAHYFLSNFILALKLSILSNSAPYSLTVSSILAVPLSLKWPTYPRLLLGVYIRKEPIFLLRASTRRE